MDFNALAIQFGDGDVHADWFRTFIRPYPGATLPTGAQLLANMPKFMNPHTAKVEKDSRRWRGRSVLTFRGVARIRPFMVLEVPVGPVQVFLPIPLREEFASMGVPEILRQLMIPQWHTDSVGLATPAPFAHSFTVQTLKRDFETYDDFKVRALVGQRLQTAHPGWIEKAATFIRDGQDFIDPFHALLTALGNYAVAINQFHFLAGRRSFLIGTAAGLQLSAPGVKPTDWVFETAALQRYSLATYRVATDYAIGGSAAATLPIWTEMGQKVASFYGQSIGPTTNHQQEFANLPAATGSAIFQHIATRHKALIPGAP